MEIPPKSRAKDAILKFRLPAEQLAAFDRLAEGRGGRAGIMRRLVSAALSNADALPRVAPAPEYSKGVRISFTLSALEVAVAESHAEAKGLTRAQWVKALVVRHIKLKGRTDDALRKAAGPIRKELRRIGVNLNQAVKAANAAARDGKTDDLIERLEAVIALRELINEQRSALEAAMRGDYEYWKVPE